jgi:hypothetical protein
MSKAERIERLEQQVRVLQEKLNEQLDAINMLLLDIKDLQQFKRFVELSSASRKSQYDVVNATREMT